MGWDVRSVSDSMGLRADHLAGLGCPRGMPCEGGEPCASTGIARTAQAGGRCCAVKRQPAVPEVALPQRAILANGLRTGSPDPAGSLP